jgi:hypothetical protein
VVIDHHANLAQPELQDFHRVEIIAEGHTRILEDFERAAIVDPELGIAVRPGHDDFPGANRIVHRKRQFPAPQHRYAAGDVDRSRDIVGLGSNRRQGHPEGDCRQQGTNGPRERKGPVHNSVTWTMALTPFVQWL